MAKKQDPNKPLYGDFVLKSRCSCGGEFVPTMRSGMRCFSCGKPKPK